MFAVLCLFACKKETTSSITGTVALFDDGTTSIENSGMKVLLEGTSPEIYALTDSEGNFTIGNVPFGTYTIIFSRDGFGTYKFFNATLTKSGGAYNITETINLGQVSDLEITDFEVHITNGSIEYTGTIDPVGTADAPKYVRIFYSTEEAVSSANYTYYSEPYQIVGNGFELPITNEELIDNGFAPGTTVYMKIYGESYWNNSYDDPLTGKLIIPNLSPNSPNIVSFVVP